jgi:hypothetical protein
MKFRTTALALALGLAFTAGASAVTIGFNPRTGDVWVDTGEVSVMPYPMVTSLMCISSTHCFMTSTGHGEPAIIPVRSDERRILTCFLEYEEDTVVVHDILHERSGDIWDTRVSSYRKLRERRRRSTVVWHASDWRGCR